MTATATATKYAAIAAAADAAGKAAAAAATPTPMIVGQSKAILGPGANEIDYSKPVSYVAGGVCGFAWVALKGNTGFARWARKAGIATPGYPSGVMIRANVGGQSYALKMAYAQAYAGVLREHGITAYPQGRLD